MHLDILHLRRRRRHRVAVLWKSVVRLTSSLTVTVTSKGQVTIPSEARRRLGIRAGTKLEFIIRDDARQAAAATKFIEGSCTPKSPGVITLVVMFELVWVLESGYRYRRSQVAGILRQILGSEDLRKPHRSSTRPIPLVSRATSSMSCVAYPPAV